MPTNANINLGVQIDPASISSATRQLNAILRDRTLKLNINTNGFALGRISGDVAKFTESLQAANSRVLAFGATTAVFYEVARAIQFTSKTFIDFESRMKAIQVILQPTVAGMQNFQKAVFDIARDTGSSWEKVSEAALNLSRQGLNLNEVLQRTSDALKLARQSGMEVDEATSALTATINTFNKELLTSTDIINKLANVDTKFAVSQRDSIESLKRAGAAAQDAGVGFKQLLAFTAELQQTTARGGAVIGNALKSIFTRVEKSNTLDALEQFNVKTRDLQGNVLSADKVLQNLANTYKTLTRSEQVAISQQVAGIQQVNQLKSLLNDLAASNSIYGRALAAATQQTNTAIDRNKLLNETLAAQINVTKQTATEFASVAGKLVLEPSIKTGNNLLQSLLGGIGQGSDDSKSAGQKLGEGVLRGLGQALAGPGLVIGASVLVNILKSLASYATNVVTQYTSLTGQSKQQVGLQNSIIQILQSGNRQYVERLALAKDINEEEKALLLIMKELNGLDVIRKSQFFGSSSGLATQGVKPTGNSFTGAAGGYLPVAKEREDIGRGVGGASANARPKVISNFNFGGGRRGVVVANTDEYLVPNYAGGEGSAIFNKQMAQNWGLPPGAKKINEAGGYIPSPSLNQGKSSSILHEPSQIAGGLHRHTITGYSSHAASGYVPNYFNKYSKDDKNYNGALIDYRYNYIYDDNGNTTLAQRLAARKRGYEILNHDDANHIRQNSKILQGRSLKIVDAKSSFLDHFGHSNTFKVLEAKSFTGDKLDEANLSKSLSKSVGLNSLVGGNLNFKNLAEFGLKAQKQFGDDFFIKLKSGAQGEGVHRLQIKNGILHASSELQNKLRNGGLSGDDFFVQKAIKNISGNEYRVNVAGVGNNSQLLGGALLRSRQGKFVDEFIGGQPVNIGSLFSGRGVSNRLSRFIAERQGARAFNDLPQNIKGGSIAGLDVLETGRSGLSKVFQALAEAIGLGRHVAGGGVAEFNFTQSARTTDAFGGQPGYSGGLDILNTHLNASNALIKNNGGFASGYVPNLSAAINREHGAGIPYSQIRISKSGELVGPGNPQGFGVSNLRDEPGGLEQGIRRAHREGRNPQNYGNAGGYLPNFANLNITPQQLGQLGVIQGGNFQNGTGARTAITDFIKNIKVDQADLAGPIHKLNQVIVQAVTDALKLDPRFLTAAQQQGAQKIANLYVGSNKRNISAARNSFIQNELQSGTRDDLLKEFAQSVPGANTFFRGGRNINNLIKDFTGRKEFTGLNQVNQNILTKNFENIALEQGSARGQRRQQIGIGASLALPVLVNGATAFAGNSRTGRQVNAGTEALATGISTAGVLGFSPVGLAVGGVVAAFLGLKGVVENSRKSLEEYSKDLEDSKGKFEQLKDNISGGFQARVQLQGLLENGGSRTEINQVSNQIQDFIRNISDPKIRQQFVSARTDDKQRDLLLGVSAKEVQEVARKGLQTQLEQVIAPNRIAGSDRFTKNVFLNNDQRNDIAGFITNALPVSQNPNRRAQQISGLRGLNGNFGLDQIEGVLGRLRIDSESRDKFSKLAVTEQEAIAKEVVARQLSAAEIEKETNNLKTFASSLLNIDRTLGQLQVAAGFNLNVSNIRNQGTRQIAIAGAQQSLGALGEFLAPETRNRFENQIKGTELQNENATNIEKITTDFSLSLKNLPDSLKNSFKHFNSNDENLPGDTFPGSTLTKTRLNQITANVDRTVLQGGNPINAANTANTEIDKLIGELRGATGEQNKKIIDELEKLRNEGLKLPIAEEQERAAQRRALQENTNRLNELTITLNKRLSFLGGGNFETTNKLDTSSITAGQLTARSLSSNLTNPFRNRILQSGTDPFNNFFHGTPIDNVAEGQRRSGVTSSLAAGRLQAYNLELFEGNPGLINQTRGLVAGAEQSSIQNQLNHLARGAQNTGDINFLDQIRGIGPGRVGEIANLRALRQVPLDDKTRGSLESSLGGINSALANPNVTGQLRNQLLQNRSGIENQIGPEGVFRELNGQLTDLNKNFNTGIQGDFKKLTDSSEAAAKSLSGLSATVENLLGKFNKEQTTNQNISGLNAQRDSLTKRLESLRENNTLSESNNDSLNSLVNKKPLDRNIFSNRISQKRFKNNPLLNGVDQRDLDVFNDYTQQFNSNKLSQPELFDKLSGTIPQKSLQGLLREQFNFNGNGDNTEGDRFRQADDVLKKINAYKSLRHPERDQKFLEEQKKLQDKLDKVYEQLNNIGDDVGKSSGYIPTFTNGLYKSLLKENHDIHRGVGGALSGDKPYFTNLAGVGPAVVNSGESIIKNFGGTGKDAVLNRAMKKKWNFADGQIPDINLDKLPMDVYNYGEGLVTMDDFDQIVKAYKSGGFAAMKKVIDKQNQPEKQKLIATKAAGDQISDADIEKYQKYYKTTLLGINDPTGQNFNQFVRDSHRNNFRNKYGVGTSYSVPSVADNSQSGIFNPFFGAPTTVVPHSQPAQTATSTPFDLNSYANSIRQANFGSTSIFGRQSAQESQRRFNESFSRNGNFNNEFGAGFAARNKNYIPSLDTNNFNRTGNVGGFRNVSLQGAVGGLSNGSRIRPRTPEENEQFYRRNYSRDTAIFKQNSGRPTNKDPSQKLLDSTQNLLNAVNRLNENNKNPEKPVQQNGAGARQEDKQNTIKVDQEIKVQVNAQINVNNDKVKDIVDQEINAAVENIKQRISNLENAVKNNKPLQVTPPRPQNPGG